MVVLRREDGNVVSREDGHMLRDGGCIEEAGW